MVNRDLQLQTGSGLWPPTWPMGLTMLRLLLLPVFLWAMLADGHSGGHPYRRVSVLIFAVMALTDKLDGYLARRLNQTTKLGTILDPVADKLLVGCSVILLSFDWVAPPGFAIPMWVVAAVYGKDLIVAVGTILVLTLVGKVTIEPRPLGRASTVLQLSMLMAVLLAPGPQAGWWSAWRALVVGLWWAVAIVAVLACADYLVQGARQFSAARAAAAAAPGQGDPHAASQPGSTAQPGRL